ncbi:MAG: hypothetical protein GX537_06895, partial [Actinobacteria bacterium]|nr:hypothetical protein [Actinomycetota bacterium]
NWMPPLLPQDFVPPVDLPWPDYVTDSSGQRGWYLPTPHAVSGRQPID